MLRWWLLVLASAWAAQLPAPVASDDVQVATSALHTLVIAPDGRVLCQGRNQYGVCGADQATAFVDTLSPVAGVPRGRAVAVADGWTSMVLGEDGRVYTWGRNDFGLFGGTDRGPTYLRPEPTAVASLEHVIGIAAFEYGGAALRDDGTVWMWGEDREGLLASGTLTKSGQSGRRQFTPQRVAGLEDVVQIAGGSKHMLALTSDGTVWAWGANTSSQLGLGDTDPRARPTTIPSLAGVTRIYAGASMSAARLAGGSWLVWGVAPSMQPPTRDVFGGVVNDMPPVRTPSPLPGLLRDASDVAVGAVVFRDGTVRTWGGNSFGSLGTGGSVDAAAPRGVLVRSLAGIVRVWAGVNRVLALKSDGALYVWGPAGTADDRVLRVPTVMSTFALNTAHKPKGPRAANDGWMAGCRATQADNWRLPCVVSPEGIDNGKARSGEPQFRQLEPAGRVAAMSGQAETGVMTRRASRQRFGERHYFRQNDTRSSRCRTSQSSITSCPKPTFVASPTSEAICGSSTESRA